jgi:DNA segregation ATPase FtsK/SpoIIIE-like protein
MTNSALQYKPHSDDRGGVLRLSAGIMLISAGLGVLLAVMPSTGGVISSLTTMVRGIAGIFAASLPIPVIASGVLLCVSSRRKVSLRGYLILMSIYLCIMAIFTLATSIPSSRQNLMAHISQSMGKNNSSWVAYLNYAYTRPNYSGGLGGGVLGMLLAYPLYSVLPGIGSIVFLILAVIILAIWLFRIDLSRVFHSISDHSPADPEDRQPRYSRKLEKENPRAEIPAPATAQIADSFYQPGSIAPESYEQEDTGLYLVPDEGAMPPAPSGFVPVQAGELYEQHIADAPAQPLARHAPARQSGQPARQQAVQPNTQPDAGQYAPAIPAVNQDQPGAGRHRRRVENRESAAGDEIIDIPTNAGRRSSSAQPIPPFDPKAKNTPDFAQTAGPPVIPAAGSYGAADSSISAYNLREGAQYQERNTTAAMTVPMEPTGKSAKAVAPAISAYIPPVPEVRAPADVARVPAAKQNPFIPSNGQPMPVYTDPAVQLTGERIPIPAKGNKTGDISISATPEKIKQLEITYYEKPIIRLLNEPPAKTNLDTSQEDNAAAERLEQTLASFNISAEVKNITHGPAITRFALRLAEGINVRRVTALMDNIAMEMKTTGVRAEVPIPGTSQVGIEVRNKQVSLVTLREVLDSPEMNALQSPMTVALGKDIMGTPVLCNLSDMPHLLIAGATGSGKSVCINAIITSILYRATPKQVRMIMIDPKMVELQPYNGIPHLLLPVVSNLKKAAGALDWVVQEMNDRYQKLQMVGARNIVNYNQLIGPGDDQMPYIVLIIDELSDLMTVCKKSVEESISRLASLARAAGICLVLATQRPSVDVITGVIKANIPSRIAFTVSSYVDSRTIIDGGGAEKLAGRGDMLYAPRTELKPKRVQGCYISDNEVSAITKYVIGRNQANYDLNIMDHVDKNEAEPDQPADDAESDSVRDEFWEEAVEMAIESGQMSISMLQRRLRIGYARAGRLIDHMAKFGIISSSEGSKSRKTLLTREEYRNKQKEGL